MRIRGLSLVAIVLSVFVLAVAARSQHPVQLAGNEADLSFDREFDDFVEATLREWHVPGLSLAVVDNGRVATKGYGFARLQPKQPATADTQYFTGSTTKAFTAAAAALLVHDNENYSDVQWKSPIDNFLRGNFMLEDEWASNHITIEDALSHRTGLPRHDMIYGQPGDTPSSVVRRMRHLTMTAEPRTTWQYCNLMYAVVTELLETVVGEYLETILEQNIWKPLGMKSTTFTIPSDAEDERSRLARGYYWDPEKEEYVPEPYIDLLPISGAGATISTVNDYALWAQALIEAANGIKHESSPIDYRIFRDLASPRAIVSFDNDEDDDEDEKEEDRFSFMSPLLYALGWMTTQWGGEKILAHNGGLTGFGAEVYIVPNRKYGIITMANTVDTSNVVGSLIATHLLSRKLGVNATSTVTSSTAGKSLSKLQMTPPLSRKHRRKRGLEPQTLSVDTYTTPLPLSLDDLAGVYSHPAYGPVNVTVVDEALEIYLYPRMESMKLRLSHVTDLTFTAKFFDPHGLGDFVSGEGIVWEDLEADYDAVVFELGLSGTTVQTMGIELEDTVVEWARKRGDRYWREGLIWFAKQ